MTTRNPTRPESPAYIAGPMSGIPEFNAPAFRSVENTLMLRGVSCFNPSAFDEAHGFYEGTGVEDSTVNTVARAAYLKRDFYYLAMSGSIVLLPGWEKSVGANCKLSAALSMGLPVYVWDEAAEQATEAFSVRPDLVLVATHHTRVRLDRLIESAASLAASLSA